MSSIKAMPLLLAAVMSFVMAAGVASAADAPIILAQFSPQQKDEHKQPQGQQQQPQHGSQQPQHGSQPPQRPQAPQHAQQPQLQQHTQQPGQQQHQSQDKAHQDHKVPEPQHVQQPREGQRKAQDPAKLHSDQVKIQQQQQQQQQQLHRDEHQLQQVHRQETVLHRELSAEDRRARAERDAHAADRARLIEHQRLMGAQEKGQAAIAERLRLQNERMRAISSQRHQIVDAHGQAVITEPGRTILQVNGHAFIQHDETANFHAFGGIPLTRRGPNGNAISTITRPDGVRIEIEVDGLGRPLRRVRYLPDGRRFVLFENPAIAVGVGFALGALIVSLPPVEVDFPREQYIVDAGSATEDDIYGALQAGPVVPLDRAYSLEEVLASVSLRERMRSISIDTISFDFGSWEVGPDQAQMLESVAAVIRDMTNQNPGEVFLVEGHTDAVGSDIDNLSLSDRRAQAVAGVLSQQFNIPRENLVTQGYGKQFLLIPTPEPERRNRRVVIRRITPLLQPDAEHYSASDGGPGDSEPR